MAPQKNICVVAVVAMAALGVLTGCDEANRDKGRSTTEERTFQISGKQLTIKHSEAGLRIQTGRGDDVKVSRTLRGSAADKGNAKVSLDGSTLKLSLVCSGVTLNCEATDVVTVPDDVDIKLEASGSRVRMTGVRQDIDASLSADASLKIEDPAGRLRLKNPGSSITVTGARSSDVEADAGVDGRVSLSFAGPPTRVAAKVRDGSVTVVVPDGAETYRLDLSGNNRAKSQPVVHDPKSSRSITVRAGDGTVRVSRA